MLRVLLFAAAPLFFAQALFAQAPDKFPLESLKIQGNQRISTERIIAASGLKVGARVAKPDFDRARAQLLSNGAFESVGYSFKGSANDAGYDATFNVVEVEQLYPYRFEELPASDEALRAVLRKQELLLGDQIPATPDILNRYSQAIRDFLGGNIATIGAISADDPQALAIVFRPVGARSNIADVRFTGNTVVTTPLLVQTISKVAVGTPYSEPLFRRLLDVSVRALYDQRGRLRVEFPKLATEKAKTNDGVVVTVTVDEGPAFKLGSVTLAGLPRGDIAQLEKSADWHKGEVVNIDDINAGVAKIRQRVRTTGYLQVQTRIDRNLHEQDHTADLTVNIEPGPQFVFGKLEIQGLDIISEPVVRKMWTLAPGQPFPENYGESFLNRVREEDIFDNLGKTHAETHIHQEERTVDVTLFFAGISPASKITDRKKR